MTKHRLCTGMAGSMEPVFTTYGLILAIKRIVSATAVSMIRVEIIEAADLVILLRREFFFVPALRDLFMFCLPSFLKNIIARYAGGRIEDMRICKEIEIDYNVCLCIHYIIRAKRYDIIARYAGSRSQICVSARALK